MKKQSATKQILNILNTKGGRKPKDLIKEIKLPASNIYAGLAYLRSKKKIAKENDGVYISQTQKEVSSKVTNKLIKSPYITKLEKENDQLHQWCLEWRSKYDTLEEKTNGLRNVVADQSAIICYLEAKLFKSESK
jgi:hypothetical protein